MTENTENLLLCITPRITITPQVDGDTILWKQWPMSIDEAAQEVLIHLSEEMYERLANTPRAAMLYFHQCFGMYVRNNLGLWAYKGWPDTGESCRKSPFWRWPRDPDVASSLILDVLWQKLQMEHSYAGVLKDPYYGAELPESFRYFGISDNEPADIELGAGMGLYLREMAKLRWGVFGDVEPPLSMWNLEH